MDRLLTLHGYRCRRNAVLEGRSGGRHEVDVLAERSDGVTTYRLAVECKAQNRPVDKEVVAKLSFVVRDLGVHQGIVVSLHGATAGAVRSARELGIEVWGPAELEARLGRLALAELAAGPAPLLGEAFPLRCPEELAWRRVRQARRGWGRRERIERRGLVWVPHELMLVVTTETSPAGRFRRGGERAVWRWNLYESVTGTLALTFPEEPEVVACDLTVSLPAGVPAGRTAAAIRQAVQRRDEVTTTTARRRHALRLDALGIPDAARSVSVERARTVGYPVYLGLLRAGGSARIVAVDGYLATRSPRLSAVLTGAIDRVAPALR